MRSYREGDWWVTTPVYVGSAESIAIAIACRHHDFTPDPSQPPKDEMMKEGVTESVVEKCSSCCARRVRYKTNDDQTERRG